MSGASSVCRKSPAPAALFRQTEPRPILSAGALEVCEGGKTGQSFFSTISRTDLMCWAARLRKKPRSFMQVTNWKPCLMRRAASSALLVGLYGVIVIQTPARAAASVGAAMAYRRILGVVHDLLGLLRRVDQRDHDALYAHVQHAAHHGAVIGIIHADQRCHAYTSEARHMWTMLSVFVSACSQSMMTKSRPFMARPPMISVVRL